MESDCRHLLLFGVEARSSCPVFVSAAVKIRLKCSSIKSSMIVLFQLNLNRKGIYFVGKVCVQSSSRGRPSWILHWSRQMTLILFPAISYAGVTPGMPVERISSIAMKGKLV